MTEGLKPGWRRVRFGDVVRQVKDKVDPEDSGLERYIAGEHMDTDDLKLRRWGEIGADYLGPAFHMRFKPGHVLYGSRRTYLRKVAVADFEGITANTTFVLEPKDPGELLPELLPFLMQTERFNEHSIKQSRGSVNPYVNFSDLAWYEFALPPLEEQRRICELLSLVDEAAEETRAVLAQLTRVELSALHSWQKDWEARYGLRSVESIVLDKPRNGYSPPTVEADTPLKTVSISSIREGSFSPVGCSKNASVPLEKVKPFLIRANDVFVVRGNGNRFLTGQAGLAAHDYHDTFYPDLLIRLRFDPEVLAPQLATAIWNSPRTHVRLIARAKSTNGIWKINGQDLRSHTLPIPPKPLQVECLDVLESFSQSRQACSQRLRELVNQKRLCLSSLVGRRQ
jgi:type I restriction enzyme, S subunit